MPQTDLCLLQRWRDGDEAAGHVLFQRHVRAIVRFFQSKTTRDHEDLVQETFMACVAGRDSIEDPARFRGYLFGVAYRTLQEHYRRQHRGFDLTQRSVSSMRDGAPSPATLQERSRREHHVALALQRLPVQMQSALELYYFEQLRAPEIATALGVAEGTVRSRIRRGLERLAAELSRQGDSPFRNTRQLETWAQSLRGCAR